MSRLPRTIGVYYETAAHSGNRLAASLPLAELKAPSSVILVSIHTDRVGSFRVNFKNGSRVYLLTQRHSAFYKEIAQAQPLHIKQLNWEGLSSKTTKLN
jgi:hypothetical protein